METEQLNKLIIKLRVCEAQLETYRNGKKSVVPWMHTWPDVARAIAFLQASHAHRGSRIGIIGYNAYEWVIIDLACLATGMVVIPFDPAVAHSTENLLQEYQLHLIVTNLEKYQQQPGVFSFETVLSYTATEPDPAFKPVQYQPTDELTWKFTSGTTQRPKAIAAMKQSVDAALTFVQQLFQHGPADKMLVFLPLHTYQQRYWIYSSILFDHDLILVPKEYVFHSLQADHPTVIMGVPFFFETLMKNFLADQAEEGPLPPAAVRERFATTLGGKIRYLWTGSAPIGAGTLTFYEEMGVPLFQGYGMNEVCIVAKNYPGHNKTGSAGKILPGKHIAFDDNNQLLIKSDYPVNTRYCRALEEDNRFTFLPDGYVATGDLGYVDEDGYLFINGRIKELIVLANAIKVHPTPIEKKVEGSPLVRHCVVFGDEHPFLVALIVPATPEVTAQQLKPEIASINENLLPHERICNFLITHEQFSHENNRLSAQNKLLRNRILNDFRPALENLYK